jgi:nucleotide-binding universal stress UspA family protein
MAVKLSARQGKIHLLHVIETIPGLSVEDEPEFYGRLEKRAAEHLASLSAPLRDKASDFEADVIYGPRAKGILDEAERIGADLVVIQSHRVGGERGHGLGTLSHQVGLFAPCPVLLVR